MSVRTFDQDLINILYYLQVMQGLKNKYPVVGTFISIAEHSKRETTSVSRSQSTSKSNAPLVETKVKKITNDRI